MLAHTTENYSPYSFVQDNPIIYLDPFGLDTVRVNGLGSFRIKVKQGDVLAWKIGNTTSYYTYDPSNADAIDGFIEGGIDNGTIESVEVTPKSNKSETVSLTFWQNAVGVAALGLDTYSNMGRHGDYMYRTSKGVVQSIFDTKYGAGRSAENIGNVANYSKNARRAISATKFLKGAGHSLVVTSILLDWGQVTYAYATNDPNAADYTAKATVNTTMTGVSFVPGVGWIVSGIYFVGDATIPGGWPAAFKAGDENVKRNREAIPNWNPRPGGGLGN